MIRKFMIESGMTLPNVPCLIHCKVDKDWAVWRGVWIYVRWDGTVHPEPMRHDTPWAGANRFTVYELTEPEFHVVLMAARHLHGKAWWRFAERFVGRGPAA